jgi:hypothetical protein
MLGPFQTKRHSQNSGPQAPAAHWLSVIAPAKKDPLQALRPNLGNSYFQEAYDCAEPDPAARKIGTAVTWAVARTARSLISNPGSKKSGDDQKGRGIR